MPIHKSCNIIVVVSSFSWVGCRRIDIRKHQVGEHKHCMEFGRELWYSFWVGCRRIDIRKHQVGEHKHCMEFGRELWYSFWVEFNQRDI